MHHSPVSMVLQDGGRFLLSKRRLSVFSWRVFEEEDVALETPAFVGQEEDILRRQAVHVDQESVEVRLETKRSKQGLLLLFQDSTNLSKVWINQHSTIGQAYWVHPGCLNSIQNFQNKNGQLFKIRCCTLNSHL